MEEDGGDFYEDEANDDEEIISKPKKVFNSVREYREKHKNCETFWFKFDN